MMMTRDKVQSIVWAIVIAVALALLLALTFRVNAVKSQVRLTERRIIAIRQEQQGLETEFQTRANQQQLAAINQVEFGFRAPDELQYVGGERQLAALSRPLPPALAPSLPPVVRMARADPRADPLSGASAGAVRPAAGAGSLSAALALADRPLAGGRGARLLSDRHELGDARQGGADTRTRDDAGARIVLGRRSGMAAPAHRAAPRDAAPRDAASDDGPAHPDTNARKGKR